MDVARSTSSPARRVQALILSRKKWKARVAAKHREIRTLRVKVRDLEISRNLWKQRAVAATESKSKSIANREAPSPGEAGPSQP
jgi:hypothetical protein